MHTSPRYKQLNSEVASLRSHLLPRKFNPVGLYPTKVYILAEAYILLTHAEFESYLEDRVKEVLAKAELEYQHNRIPHLVVKLIMQCETKAIPVPETIAQNIAYKRACTETVVNAFKLARSAVYENNGIKEKDILRLLSVVGIDISSVDLTLIADMNSFGADRGKLAHSARSTRVVSQQVDPRSAYTKVRNISKGLGKIDQLLNKAC